MASVHFHEISEAGLRTLKYYYVVRDHGKKVMHEIFIYAIEGISKSLMEVIEANGFTVGCRKGHFKQEEVDKLSTKDCNKVDITLLNKFCQKLWQHEVVDPGDPLKEKLRNLKDERNEVIRERFLLSKSELERKLRDFENLLHEVIDEAAKVYSQHSSDLLQKKKEITQSIKIVKEKMHEKYDLSKPEERRRFDNMLLEYGDDLRDLIREIVYERIIQLLKQQCKARPFDLLLDDIVIHPSNFSVPLRFDTEEAFHRGYSKGVTLLSQKEILQIKNLQGENPEVVIVSGDAGAGKSTLLCFIGEMYHRNFPHDIPNLCSYDLILYFEFRSQAYVSLKEYLRSICPDVIQDFSYDHVLSTILNSKVLILCDGYDESNELSLKTFSELLEMNCTQQKMMIVTTRPGNTKLLTEKVKASKSRNVNLSILGLRDKEKKLLIETITKHLITDDTERKKMEEKIKNALVSLNPEMKKMMSTPLLFNSFIVLYIVYPEVRGVITSVSKLYMELDKFKIRRFVNKHEVGGQEKAIKFKKILNKKSAECHYEQKYEMTDSDVKDIFTKSQDLNLNQEAALSTFLSIKHSRKGTDITKIFTYGHLSEQEFAAAASICDDILQLQEDEQCASAKEEKKWKSVPDWRKGGESSVTTASASIPNIEVHEEEDFFERATASIREQLHNNRRILRFVIGILFNTNKLLLYSVLPDVLNYYGYDDDEWDDQYVELLVETSNDANVIEAVVKKIRRDKAKHDPTLRIAEKSLHSVIPLIHKFSGWNLSLQFTSWLSDDMKEDLTQIVTVSEVLFKNQMEMKLCFFGNPTNCNHLSSYLGRIMGLSRLLLWIEEGAEAEPLLPIHVGNNLKRLGVVLTPGKTSDQVVNLLNGFWNSSLETVEQVGLMILETGWSESQLEAFFNKLLWRNVTDVLIGDVTEEAKEKENSFREICERRGITAKLLLQCEVDSDDEDIVECISTSKESKEKDV